MATNKLISIFISLYGLVYLLLPHDLHQKGWVVDALIGKWIGWEGFPHYIHLILGALLAFYGVMLWSGKYKTPKFLSKLYKQKEY